MTWKFWKKSAKPVEATRPASLGGPSKVGGYSGPARGSVDPVPPKTTGTLRPVGVEPPAPWPQLPNAPRRPVAGKPFHGGEIPALAELEPYTAAWQAKLEELLPQGARVNITIAPNITPEHIDVVCKVAPTDIPNRDYMANVARGKNPQRQDLKDFTYGQIALQIAGLGTCCRLKVGCVLLTEEGRVAGMGYNGAGPGMPHCNENHCNENCRCIRTVHAEQNALNASSGKPYTAYVTHEPCLNCTKELALAGVRRVVFLKPYSSIAPAERDARQEWLNHYNIAWEQLPASGAI